MKQVGRRKAGGARRLRVPGPWIALLGAFLLQASPASATETSIVQTGTDGVVQVDQTGANNSLDVWQLQGKLDALEAVQAGSGNTARVVQSGLGAGTSGNLVVLRQAGTGGTVDLQQYSIGGTAAVFQSGLGSGNQATLFQAAIAPIGVIEQGVARTRPTPTNAATEAARVRAGTLVDAASSQSTAILLQAGGNGLTGVIVQGGVGQSAFVSQAGAYLEAEVVQYGGAHSASITQAGIGAANSPHRASVMQFGAQPQGVSIQQTVGSSPRNIRIVQQ